MPSVGFDAKMTGGNGVGGFNQDISAAVAISSTGMTVGASATILVALAVWQCGVIAGPTGRTMTWNGVSMTEGPFQSAVLAGSQLLAASVWTLASPASGNKTLAGAWTNNCDCYLGCASFNLAALQAADNTVAVDVTTINVPTDANGATIAVFGVDGNAATTNFITLWSEAPFAPGGAGNYQLGGTGTNGHSFTGGAGSHQVLAGIHLIATGGGGVQSPLMGQILL